ncbi:hypothetical protein LAG90_14940 [Marinilongibacter aquaticus]|uniref:DUF6252 family protein n=1 Tax=Marinilongibacter aquaticus TaxID=2975157 RepID=UPI0021BD940B|nr:DUF6252 family protein [Marinilongibacter aquaticus]UBM58100.1 hypothetical protein LAG90_14940 [Marinilongibacter aquaticus]
MKKVLFTLIFSLALQSCDWIKSLGPEETFFCKINGQKFRPDKDNSPIGGWGSKPLSAVWNTDSGRLFIYARNSPKVITLTLIFDNPILHVRNFELGLDTGISRGQFTPENQYDKPVRSNISLSGKASIKKMENYKISGTFEFVCKDSTNNKEYCITEGEFNKLSYY